MSSIHYARLIAIPLPFFMSGYSICCSQNAIPAILNQPAEQSTVAFTRVFNSGAAIAIPTAAIAAVAQSYLAYAVPMQRTLWSVAAVATISIVPFTRLVMIPGGIERLVEISRDEKMQAKATASLEHRQLMQKWVVQNYVRSLLLAAGGVAAIAAGGI